MTQQSGTGGGDDPDGHRGAGGGAADLLARHLEFIKSTIRKVGHRQRLDPAELEDFEGAVLLKLCDRDYAVLRSFQGRSLLTTFLVTIINRAYLDYRIKIWGKWRPSAIAKRLGPRAILLDRMVRTEGRTIDEARARLAAAGDPVDRETLVDLLDRLPLRARRRAEGDAAIDVAVSPHAGPDEGLEESDRQRTARLAEHHLREALALLPPEDRALIGLVHAGGLPIRRLAGVYGVKPRALYAKVHNAHATMRRHFMTTGLDPKAVLDLLGRSGIRIEIAGLRASEAEKPAPGPSHSPEGEEPA